MSAQGLFQPIRVGKNLLKHRVVPAPLTRMRNTAPGNVPNEKSVDYYSQRAGNGGGLLITEATFISPMAGGYPTAPGIFSKEQIEAWKKITALWVTEGVHAKGSYIFSQLWHVGRATTPVFLPNNAQPVSASAIAIQGNDFTGQPYQIPRAIELEDIPDLINDYVKAAENAMDAGFDGVEIHGANGYLLDQFIESNSNKRTDKYGGSIENRARLALEVVDAVQKAIGPEKTAIRFSPWTSFQDMKDETPLETWSYLTRELQDNHPNLAYLHFIEPRTDPTADGPTSSANSLDPFRKIWKSNFISSGGYGHDLQGAIEHAEKTGDMIAFGRQFIANPDLPYRIEQNLSLNKYDRTTFYTSGREGYTDYPTYDETQTQKINAAA